jgi:transposase
METWETIRLRCRRDGEKIKVVARDLGLAPNTVRKYLRRDNPPTKAKIMRSKTLDRYQSHVDELIRSTPKITAVRIGSWLRQNVDAELRINERVLRSYVATRRTILVPKEAFVRACYAPGDQAQFDFSPMSVKLDGSPVVVQLFVLRLSYSGRWFARASIRCDQTALFSGLIDGFKSFGGITRSAIFDNASIAVKRILRGRNRDENEAFTAFRGGLALHVEFAAPAKGNEKGGVEGMHGFIEDNFFRPTPEFSHLDELNAALATFAREDLARTHTVHRETIGERFAHEQPFLQDLPTVFPRACITRYARINKFAEVCFETNRYSVPSRYAHRNAIIEVYENRVRIMVEAEVVAEHSRGFGSRESFLDPRHYIDLLQRKHRAAASALVLSEERIPTALHDLFNGYLHADAASASKRWTQVLSLLAETSAERLAEVVTQARARGTDDPAAIALLLRQRPDSSTTISRNDLPVIAQAAPPIVDLMRYATENLMESAA